MNIIQTNNLTKSFGKTLAVHDVTINVRSGEIYGFLGLNGAGKTTTIRLLLGMIRQDEGSVLLFGKRIKQASEIWNNVGYLVETPFSYPDLTVKENLEVIFRLRELSENKMIADIIDRLQLSRYQSVRFRHLSMGNKQRLGLAKALMHHPKLLILDEPINGLDPAGIADIRAFLKELVVKHNTTIFLSSHILSEIARLATRIGIVHQGKLKKEINSHELDDQIIKKLRIQTINDRDALDLLNGAGYNFQRGHGDFIETDDQRAIQKPEMIATLLVQKELPPRSLSVFEEDLESYFLRTIGS